MTNLIERTTTPLDWAELRLAAELFSRAQTERIAVGNTVRRSEDGGNLPADWMQHHVDALQHTEDEAKKTLRAIFRRVVPEPIRSWQESELGIGEHLVARLLGATGDPLVAYPHHWEGSGTNRILVADEPHLRTAAQFRQFCGHGAPGRPMRGMKAEDAAALGNPRAKMIVHLMAEGCVKAKGNYRDLYDAVRLSVEDKAHSVPCVRCGPSGSPAQPGTPWSKGHQHNHALRMIGKAILDDLWTAAQVRREG